VVMITRFPGSGCCVTGLLKPKGPEILYRIGQYAWQCASSRLGKSLADEGEGFTGRCDRAFELRVFHGA
jgi:hypothetical protein